MGILNSMASLTVDPTALVAVSLYDPASYLVTLLIIKHGKSTLTFENFPSDPCLSISSSFTVQNSSEIG